MSDDTAPVTDASSIRRLPGYRSPLAWVAVAAMGGILLADSLAPAWWILTPVAVAMAFWALASRRFFPLLIFTATVFGLVHSLHLAQCEALPPITPLDRASPDNPRFEIEAEGVVIDEPKIYDSGAASCLLRLERVSGQGTTFAGTANVRFYSRRLPKNGLSHGDRIRFTGWLGAVPSARNPGSFDPAVYYFRAQDAVAEVEVTRYHRLSVAAHHQGSRLLDIAHLARDWMAAAITRGLEQAPEASAILKAMVLGIRDEAPEPVLESFRLSGTLHLFAVSGLHVGIFALILTHGLIFLRVPRRTALFLAILAVFFYALVTGLRPSAVRAAIMAAAVMTGFLLERKARLTNSLGLAALIILALNTQQLFLPGFQLSFAVLTAIVLLPPRLIPWMTRPLQPDPFLPTALISKGRRALMTMGRHVAATVAVSVAAWAGSLLLTIHHFHIVTPVAMLANVFVAWLAVPVLSAAMISLAFSLVHLFWLSSLTNLINCALVKLITLLVSGFATIPGGSFHVSPATLGRGKGCEVVVFDTADAGGAQAITVRRGWGRRTEWLIDCGDENAAAFVTGGWLEQHGVNRLDGLALTHGDANHIAGASLISEAYHPRQLIETALENRSPSYDIFLEALGPDRHRLRQAVRGDAWKLGPDTRLETLFPPPGYPGQRVADDRCLVLRLEHGPWKILFLSDSGFITEKWLLENEPSLHCNVLVKGRHRDDYSGLEEFIRAASPSAVISTNADFPDNERIPEAWRKFLEAQGITLFDQSETGAVTISSDGPRLRLRGYLNGQTFTVQPLPSVGNQGQSDAANDKSLSPSGPGEPSP